ncbi:MAG: hypothetical protein RLZZ26_382 [Candidatus Parcubacteria bacterium]|jgi:hypothetical protein
MKSNTTILIVAGLIVLAGGYWYFSAKTSTGNDATLTATTDQNESQAQFQTLVVELQPITFNTDIFTDARFMSLIDLATLVTPEVPGRIDPFAPVAAVPVVATSTHSTSSRTPTSGASGK